MPHFVCWMSVCSFIISRYHDATCNPRNPNSRFSTELKILITNSHDTRNGHYAILYFGIRESFPYRLTTHKKYHDREKIKKLVLPACKGLIYLKEYSDISGDLKHPISLTSIDRFNIFLSINCLVWDWNHGRVWPLPGLICINVLLRRVQFGSGLGLSSPGLTTCCLQLFSVFCICPTT